jgi:hypothetical protein
MEKLPSNLVEAVRYFSAEGGNNCMRKIKWAGENPASKHRRNLHARSPEVSRLRD